MDIFKGKSPFLNLHHVGWVVRDINKTIATFESLGVGPWQRYRMPSPGHEFSVREHFGQAGDPIVYEGAVGKMGPIFVELFECIAGDSVPKRFLDRKGEGIWHLSYIVTPEEFDATIAEMAKNGYEAIGSSTFTNGVRMVFFDAKMDGVILQLHDSDDF